MAFDTYLYDIWGMHNVAGSRHSIATVHGTGNSCSYDIIGYMNIYDIHLRFVDGIRKFNPFPLLFL